MNFHHVPGRYRRSLLEPKAGLEDMLAAAFEEYRQNARYPHPNSLIERPDGELVIIYDEDAGF
jgi:hypothetical protein